MSHTNGETTATGTGVEHVVQPWLDYWAKLFEQNTQWTQSLMAGAPPDVDPAKIRGEWMGALSKSIDGYLRSPTFLESMRQNAEAMTATKVTSELAKFEMARQAGVPHIEDIRGLYDRLETAHATVIERLQNIEQRLTAIERQLDSNSNK